MKKKKAVTIILMVVAALVIVFVAYVGDYYRALPEAEQLAQGMSNENGDLYMDANGDTGIIIYPGGKVDEQAYAPLAQLLYERGYTTVIAKMPFRLSILDNDKAAKIIDARPGIADWYIAGHSLGGTSASIFAEKYPDAVKGIAFLGSYPYKDLSGTGMAGLSVTGSNDMILDREAAQKSLPYYPEQTKIEIIEGGNHSGFASYGLQEGDGEPGISNEEQIADTVKLIVEAFGRADGPAVQDE